MYLFEIWDKEKKEDFAKVVVKNKEQLKQFINQYNDNKKWAITYEEFNDIKIKTINYVSTESL